MFQGGIVNGPYNSPDVFQLEAWSGGALTPNYAQQPLKEHLMNRMRPKAGLIAFLRLMPA